METYILKYHRRGNPIPPAALRHLQSTEVSMAVVPPPALLSVMPILFDPLKPSSLAKQTFNLQINDDQTVSVKTSDGRKSVAAKERAKRLKL